MDIKTDSKTQKNNWPTPAESVGMKIGKKHKYKKKYTHSKISSSHRIPKRVTPSIFDLPPICPKTGLVSSRDFTKVVGCVFKDMLKCEEQGLGMMLSKLKEFLIRKNKMAVVKNKWTGVTSQDLSVRSCLKTTSKSLPKLLAPVLEPIFSESFRGKNFIESRLDPTHADLLLYREKDFFGFHSDQILDFPFDDIPVETIQSTKRPQFTEPVAYNEARGKWYMYSVILCLDSNLSSQGLRDDGNTVVCLPARSFLENPAYRDEIIKSNLIMRDVMSPGSELKNKELSHHVFHQSITPRNFVVFPSNASHASAAITQNGGYKFALKMDLWVLVPHKLEEIQITRPNLPLRYHHLDVEMALLKAKNESKDILRYASYYGIIKNRNIRINTSHRYLEYGPGNMFHSITGISSRCSCKRCEHRAVEIKHIGENLNNLCCLCKILPKDIIFIVASFLKIGRVNDSDSIDGFKLIDNKSLIFHSSVQNALDTPRPNHSKLRSAGGIYNYRLVIGDTPASEPSTKMSSPGQSSVNFANNAEGAKLAARWAFDTGKLKLLTKNYTDYYAFLDDRNRGSARCSGDCICDRVNPWIFFKQIQHSHQEMTKFDIIAKQYFANYDNIVCKCTCLGCIRSCVIFDGNYYGSDSEYEYDDESHCNGDDY